MENQNKGFFQKLFEGLSKTRSKIISSLENIFSSYDSIDEDFYEEVEEVLVMSDLGVNVATNIIESLKEIVKDKKLENPSECKKILVDIIKANMELEASAYDFENQKTAILVIGVNGVGKTTSVAKLASYFKEKGKKVLLVAADTFRAGAIEQLKEWSKRADVDIIIGNEGADPASIVFDACKAAKARKVDILICDTAGRLHNKKNLMEELKKIDRIVSKEFEDSRRETLLVLDSTTGQNALMQAKLFNEASNIDGIVLTKLDGTAKGGVAISIQAELGIPVKYIGIGEKLGDLQKFNVDEFVDALFDVTNIKNEENVNGEVES